MGPVERMVRRRRLCFLENYERIGEFTPTRHSQVSCYTNTDTLSLHDALPISNHSVNRTHCGGPPFGLKRPNPNASPPQRAGYLKIGRAHV